MMTNRLFKDKTYRIINIDGKVYSGKDAFKNRTCEYIIEMFDEDYFNNKTVLDLGCASGAVLFDIKNKIKKGIGVDIDPKKLNIGKFICDEHKIKNIFFHEQRFEKFINQTEETYDCIFLLNVLHHVQSPYKILNIAAEISDDLICIEAPKIGFYDPYDRDFGKKIEYDKLNIEDIISFLQERNYDLLIKQESENQENFIGDSKRFVCFLRKKH